MPVVGSADGAGALAGSVVSVGSDTATVRLIVDTRSSVVALDQQTRALGLVQGQLGGQLVMVQVDVTDDLAEGDTIVTAGLELAEGAARSPYPSGLLIGHVQAVEHDTNALTQTAFVRPAARLPPPRAPAGGAELPAGLMAGGAPGHMAPSAVSFADHRGMPGSAVRAADPCRSTKRPRLHAPRIPIARPNPIRPHPCRRPGHGLVGAGHRTGRRGDPQKVVIIVGPTGALTDSYRADGNAIAAAATPPAPRS